jgi:hypothetical protein
MPNSPTPPNNPPTPPNNPPTPPNNPPPPPNNLCDTVRNLFQDFVHVITHDKLANFIQILPYLVGIVIFLAPIALLIQNWYSNILNSQDLNENFQKQICKNYEILVQERLKIEEDGNETIGKISPVDNKNRKTNQLPFSCEYTLLKDNKNSGSNSIILEINPLFSDFITTVDKKMEEKIDLKEVCRNKTIIKQMREKSQSKGEYNEAKGDKIIPGDPSLDKTKKDVYPVFQWVCSYEIQRKEENSSDFQQNSFHTIDLKLEPYCEHRAAEDGTNRKKPTHHYYNDPYSLYCADPRSKRTKK